MLRVPKSLMVSQAVELCRRHGQRMVHVLDMIDESFTLGSPPLHPGPVIGFAVPVDDASGKVNAKSIPASCSARPSSSVAITMLSERQTARLASERSLAAQSDRL